jgi:hypothetical protein
MGEGWGDFFATQIRKTTDKKYADYPMGGSSSLLSPPS